MPLADWFRPPRQLVLVFLVVAVISTATLAWLTRQLLANDRVAEQQRRQEDLDRSADAAATAIEGTLARLERHLDPSEAPTDALPHGAVAVSYDAGAFVVTPRGGLAFYPVGIPSRDLSSEALKAAERLELAANDLANAGNAYARLAAGVDPVMRVASEGAGGAGGAKPPGQEMTRAAALVRLARVRRKQQDWHSARATYDRIEDLGDLGIDNLPARLIARVGRASIHEELREAVGLRAEGTALADDLKQGRLHLTKPQYDFYVTEIRRWLGTDPGLDDSARMRGEAFAWLWARRMDVPSRSRRLIAVGTDAALVSWRSSSNGAGISAVILDAGALRTLTAGAIAANLGWALTDPEGKLIAGEPPPARETVTRTAAATGLPWTLHTFAKPDARVQDSSRRTLILFIVASVAGLLVAGWYFIWRGVSREVRVARLQSDFVAAVSHEFRSPLTSLRHIAELLATDRMPSEARRQQAYAVLVSETDRLSHLVEGLLDFGRLQAGKATLVFARVDVTDLVRQIVDQFTNGLDRGRHRIELTTNLVPSFAMVDREGIVRALRNLLDNAVKYSPDGGRVDVSVSKDPEAATVSIAVRDEGLGIAPADERRIFDRFVRGADAAARRISGTGIGLAMAREIVRAHGGDIAVSSQVGVGSVFTITLPAVAHYVEILERSFNVDERAAR